ncbi:MAG: spore maturation protein [Proteobacteria bacterium]|nr:spore maturation protein [Pseudomonadota bacterium]
MNLIFFLLIFCAYCASVWQQWHWTASDSTQASPMHLLTDQLLHGANDAVTLAFGLVGVLALFMGLMKIMEEGGLLQSLANLLYPLLKWLFPEIPANHPAFGAMVMNLSANLIGMGNAATPFGLKAMQELDKLNPHPGIATNAMVLFLAINTSCITLLPTKIIALRAAAGSADPAGIITTTLFATICATVVAIFAAKFLQRILKTPPSTIVPEVTQNHTATSQYPVWVSFIALSFLVLLIPLTLAFGKSFSPWIMPTLIVGVLVFGMVKKIDIYATFIEGAKSGFEIALKVLPFLVAMLAAISMFRASGLLDALTSAIAPFTSLIGIPAEAVPMVIMRPLSGSGSFGVMTDVINNPLIGPDSYTGYLVSTMMGSTETTFYVLAVYFGAVQIRRIRHALAAGLIAEMAGMIASVVAVKLLIFS